MIPTALIIYGFIVAIWVSDKREAAWSQRWQDKLDRDHHGTPLKPYDWELEK